VAKQTGEHRQLQNANLMIRLTSDATERLSSNKILPAQLAMYQGISKSIDTWAVRDIYIAKPDVTQSEMSIVFNLE
jgi:hypothetical protein